MKDHKVKVDLIPPTDPVTGEMAAPTGDVFRDARGVPHVVYKMNMVDEVATREMTNKEPVIDPETSKQLVRRGMDGPYRVWVRPTRFREVEFILQKGFQGEVRIQRDFRPPVVEVGETEELRDALKSVAPESITALLDSIKAKKKEEEASVPQPSEDGEFQPEA